MVQIPDKRMLLSDWRGWDHLVFGGYIPVDQADSRAFGQSPVDWFGTDVPTPREWPDDLVAKAQTSWIRCLRIEHGPWDQPAAGTQFVVFELRHTNVVDIVTGPPLADAGRWWWDHHLTRHPDYTDRRERSPTPLAQLRLAIP